METAVVRRIRREYIKFVSNSDCANVRETTKIEEKYKELDARYRVIGRNLESYH